ncbi:MAG: ABC transporter ATP-binding protein [Rhizobiales bacterium 24-66-13]|nr:MAG: ABC transporter ATP-binding protein [Rhizobiales bacterium 35-66-30]OYZ82855.1 MAG: ABC transporter ATP-binding protein [Rhizobiales bacterium 24-66-13]OZB11401.1 MAG: ABC transporter ATP-binding protein [Rhizobiales bacterium 39-66-18]HQS45719.1 ABC transporter ATP-binding protein [Xanthobacteraceae bacterium]
MHDVRPDDFIIFTDVAKSFQIGTQQYTAIRDVTMSIKRGEIAMLLGPSGCGKSTLLNLAAGLIGPSAGQVVYDGALIAGLNAKVAYMTQQDHLLPWRTVAGNIAVPLEVAGLPRRAREARLDELLTLVGLTDFAKSYPNQISGGMRKRCALARLLAANRETLLLDEPFSALDAQLRLTLQAELLRICRKLNLTVMFVTHDIEEAAGLGDKCAVFQGRPGKIAKVFDNPLPKERDLMRLRFDPRHHAFTNELWATLTPDLQPPVSSPIALTA